MRRLTLIVPFDTADQWPTGVAAIDCLRLNPKHANVMGVCVDYMRMSVLILLTHPEFPDCPPGCEAKIYDAEELRARLPYLFEDGTDPLLYRRFDDIRASLASFGEAMLRSASLVDDRIRDSLLYHGTATGRWLRSKPEVAP